MAKHNHDKCKHVLSFCVDCDVVSCEKCTAEWKKPISTWTTSGTTNWGVTPCSNLGFGGGSSGL